MPPKLSRNQRPASLENLDLMEIASDVEKLEATSRRAAVKIAKAAEQIKAMKKKLEANGA